MSEWLQTSRGRVRDRVTPIAIHSFMSEYFPGARNLRALQGGTTPVSTSWGAANQIFMHLMILPHAYPVRRVFWGNGSALGTMDLGIHTYTGRKIYRTSQDNSNTAITQVTTSWVQYRTPSSEIWLAPGAYWISLVNNGTTNRGLGSAASNELTRFAGARRISGGSAVMPDDISGHSAPGQAGWFLCGITRSTV